MTNIYPQHIKFNGSEIAYEEVTNDWVLANKPKHLLLSANPLQIQADPDGVIVSTISIQLQTPLLIEGSRQNIAIAGSVQLAISIGDERIIETIMLDDNGHATHDVFSAIAGIITVTVGNDLLSSNTINIEVV